MTVLEDLLVEAEAKEKPAILDLLRQSYTELARQAQLSGREREAAHYRDNLAILDQGRPATPPSESTRQSSGTKPRTQTDPKPAVGLGHDADAAGKVEPGPLPAKAPKVGLVVNSPAMLFPEPASLPEPAPMSEPVKIPAPRPASQPLPPSGSSSAPTPDLIDVAGSPSPASPRQNRDAGETAGTIAPPAPARSTPPPAASTSGTGAGQTASPKQRRVEATPEEADRLFSAKQYTEAGRRYGALARENHLPANRKNHWAYCRMVDVAQRMNARPQTLREWDEIEKEIQSIQRLAPNLWYGEYLRNKLADIRRRPRAQSDKLIVQSSTPDESKNQDPTQNQGQGETKTRRLPRLFGRSSTATPGSSEPTGATAQAAPPASAEQPLKLPANQSQPRTPIAQKGDENTLPEPSGTRAANRSQAPLDTEVVRAGAEPDAPAGMKWQVHETLNFRIFHCDARLAKAAGEAAELARADQAKRWGSPALQRPWTPRCEIQLYPSGREFAQATGQTENSPGFSTILSNGNRVTARRTSLRGDHPQLLTAILPHEVTHVVLADLFTVQQIPRWADEGMAVLAEPNAEQNLRAAELQEPLETGRVLEINKLMSMDYPEAKDWSLYYAQSVSLTRFLVEQGTPERFLQFVRDVHRTGIEAALQSAYGIGGLNELQDRWLAYARQQLATLKVARRSPSGRPSATSVR